MFATFPWLNVILSCFKRLPSSQMLLLFCYQHNLMLELLAIIYNYGLLSSLAGGLITSSDNPWDFHSEIWSALLIFLNNFPPDMRNRSDVSFRSDIGRDVVGHAETLSWRHNWNVNETDLSETTLQCLIGT